LVVFHYGTAKTTSNLAGFSSTLGEKNFQVQEDITLGKRADQCHELHQDHPHFKQERPRTFRNGRLFPFGGNKAMV